MLEEIGWTPICGAGLPKWSKTCRVCKFRRPNGDKQTQATLKTAVIRFWQAKFSAIASFGMRDANLSAGVDVGGSTAFLACGPRQ